MMLKSAHDPTRGCITLLQRTVAMLASQLYIAYNIRLVLRLSLLPVIALNIIIYAPYQNSSIVKVSNTPTSSEIWRTLAPCCRENASCLPVFLADDVNRKV